MLLVKFFKKITLIYEIIKIISKISLVLTKITYNSSMKKFFIYSLTIFLLSACSYKQNSTTQASKQSVANTKKSEIIKNNKTQIFITVTFLDNLKEINDNRYEEFIVALYFPDAENSSVNKKDILNNITFLIDNKAPFITKKLPKDNKLLEKIPASNPWSYYFLVKLY